MTRPDVMTAAAGILAVVAAVVFSATAAADPLPPPSPAPADPAPPPPTGFLPPAGTLQSFLPDGGITPGSGYDFLLGQAPAPTVSGGLPNQGLPPGTIIDPQAIQALRSINFALDGQGQQSLYSYTPAAPDAPPGGFLANAKGAHGIWNYQMGKLDPSQLGQPLPGTAPPPGTNIPVGLGQEPPDPSAPPPPVPQVPPPAG